ncbi:MAG: hypothetical protein HC904_03320 [Blastochloris sp.]|nr:hypothetical protein [Blastochloris sp.]
MPVFYVEAALKFSRRPTAALYQAVSNFPALRRDLAFVVDRKVSNREVLEAIQSLGLAELQEVVCFDVFQDETGQKLASGKKSMAYALTYRSSERTLTEKEVGGWQDQVVAAVQGKVGAVLR